MAPVKLSASLILGLLLAITSATTVGAESLLADRNDAAPGSPADQVSGSPANEAQPVQISVGPVDPDERFALRQDVRLAITVVNGREPIRIDSISLSIPEEMALSPSGKPTRADGQAIVLEEPVALRTPGKRLTIEPIRLSPKPWLELKWSGVPLLTYTARKEVFVAGVTFTNLRDGLRQTENGNLIVSVEPTPIGMYAGALVGLVLGSTFLLVYGSNSAQSNGTRRTTLIGSASVARSWFRELALRITRGAVATALAILLFQTTSNISFITIAVHDFYGGVLLGLFADSTARTIYQKIMSS